MPNLARPISLGTFGPGWADGTPPAPPEPGPEPPAITGNFSPVQAPVSGGSTHMLPGSGFEGVTRVMFSVAGWSSDAADFEVVSDNQLWAEAPEYTGGNTPPVAAQVSLWHPLGNAQRGNALVYMAGEIEEPEEPPEEETE